MMMIDDEALAVTSSNCSALQLQHSGRCSVQCCCCGQRYRDAAAALLDPCPNDEGGGSFALNIPD